MPSCAANECEPLALTVVESPLMVSATPREWSTWWERPITAPPTVKVCTMAGAIDDHRGR